MKHERPPRISAAVLSWLLADDWETPTGDFEEYFQEMVRTNGSRKARSWYRRQVWSLLPGRVVEKMIWSMVMLTKYLSVAVRTMGRHRWTSVINIGGLAIGLSATLLIGLFVQDELSFDEMHSQRDRIVRVVEAAPTPAGGTDYFAFTMNPLGPAAVENLPQVQAATRLFSSWTLGRQTLTAGDVTFYEGDYLTVDSTFFDLFDYRFLAGDRMGALNGPNKVVLTESAALQYFGQEDPMGRILQFQWQGDMEVTGIVEDPPSNTHLHFSMLVSMATLSSNPRFGTFVSDWATRNAVTYLLMEPGFDLAHVEADVNAIAQNNVLTDDETTRTVTLQPMSDIHFGSAYITYDFNAGARTKRTTFILGLVGLFILLIAIFNYTNLSTVVSIGRSREVGMRLAVGAHRSQVVKQFLGEAVVTTVFAVVMGWILAWMVLPVFNVLAGKTLSVNPLSQPELVPVLGILALFVGLTAGMYPALVLSRHKPSSVLKGATVKRASGHTVRNGLVVAQFALSIGLILGSLVVYSQLVFFQQTDLGFNQEQLVIVDINSSAARNGFETIKRDMLASPHVTGVSVSSNIPGDWKNISQVDVWAGGSDASTPLTSYFLGVDADFLSTYEIGLLQGRPFEPGSRSDSLSVLLTESTAAALGVGLGDRISIPESSLNSRAQGTTFEPTVVGIVNDFNFQSLHETIQPMILGYWTNPVDVIDYFSVRIDGQAPQQTIAALQAVGKEHDPETPFEYNFLDERMQDFYVAETQLGRMVGLSTLLAILLACLGLFALTSYTTTLRTKEIGVRRVLGASVSGIVVLLSRDVLRLVAIAFVLAAPLAWFATDSWLNTFAFRISLGWEILLLAAIATFLLAFLSIFRVALRAASANPADSMRLDA